MTRLLETVPVVPHVEGFPGADVTGVISRVFEVLTGQGGGENDAMTPDDAFSVNFLL